MDGGNWKEMFGAVTQGDLELVRYHLRMGIDPNFEHPETLSLPLVEAARLGREGIARLLLEAGADPRRKASWEGMDAITMARTMSQRGMETLLEAHLRGGRL